MKRVVCKIYKVTKHGQLDKIIRKHLAVKDGNCASYLALHIPSCTICPQYFGGCGKEIKCALLKSEVAKSIQFPSQQK